MTTLAACALAAGVDICTSAKPASLSLALSGRCGEQIVIVVVGALWPLPPGRAADAGDYRHESQFNNTHTHTRLTALCPGLPE